MIRKPLRDGLQRKRAAQITRPFPYRKPDRQLL
jgi:hypothetical protein